MKTNHYERIINELLSNTGIRINGEKPEDVKINDSRFYRTVIQNGSLGLGESYMRGWWDCEALDVFFESVLKARLEKKIKNNYALWIQAVKSKLLNLQTKAKSIASINRHYNIGNELYQAMLDPHMMYSCGYWENAKGLYQAQTNKLELICKKLDLKPGLRVLEIGCGWGGFAAYAAKNYHVHVTGITISTEQETFAKDKCEGLDVDIRLQDYRDLDEKFDRIVSIGMFEHVGQKNYSVYMKVVKRNLTDDGISLLHTIGSNEAFTPRDPWIDKYIFPNSRLPSVVQIASAMERHGLVMQDWHAFGRDYDTTLLAWLHNFKQAWPALKANYDEVFYRMWVYYLSCCAASFRVGNSSLWQVVFTKNTYNQDYRSIRSLDHFVATSKSLLEET